MGDVKVDEHLRGKELNGAAYEKPRNNDTELHLDGEEDTLYEDGLELQDDSSPLTGINGRDDTTTKPI
jgi:hypothetical protein